jgi:rubrerythrin
MKTSIEWWNEVKQDEEKLNEWLVKQWRGEVTAALRIQRFSEQFAAGNARVQRILAEIAKQEDTHAQWVGELLARRGILYDVDVVQEAEKRYWKETLPGITSLETGAAVAAQAESMRLERIRTIADDVDAPTDIRLVFQAILKDEVWHEAAFTQLASDEAFVATKGNHELGRLALGLEA